MRAGPLFVLAAALLTAAASRASPGVAGAGAAQDHPAQPDAADAEAALIAAHDDQALGRLLLARASAAFGRGEPGRAAAYWRRALQVFQAAGDTRQQADVLYSLSFVERADTDQVVRGLARARALAREAGDVALEGQIVHRWSDEQFLTGQFAEAIDRGEQAVRLLEQAEAPDRLARALTSLGRVYRVHGQYDRALAIYRRGLALHESTNDVPGIVQSLRAVATGLRRVGQVEDGLVVAQRAVRMLPPADRSGALALTLNTLAALLGDLDRTSEALAAVDRGLALAPQPRDAVLLHESRAVFLSRLGRHGAAVVAAERALALADGVYAATAIGRGRLVALLASVRAASPDGAAALDDSARAVALIEEERRRTVPQDALRAGFDETTQWVYGQHVQLLARAGRAAEALETAERARARAFTDLLATRQLVPPDGVAPRDRLAAGGRDAEGVAIVATASPPSLAEIRAQAARLDTTVLAYWVHRDETVVWAVTAGGDVRSARMPVTARRLEALVRDTWTPSATGGGSRTFRQLYDLLIAPVTSSLPRARPRRLTIVPHGPLFRLSFAALKSPAGRYLVEDYGVHYAPSVGVLATTAAARATGRARGDFQVVADPTLSPAVAGDELRPLPGALAEGQTVAALGGAPANALLARAHATEGRVRELAGGHRVLHFATHAVVSDDHPLDSFLALAGDGPAHEADGRLSAEEVYGLRLDADLVVLSGCRTAGGRITGDGITGLARAFFYAGTPALVASLWELPDTAGRAVLPRFYRHWRQSGDKAAALQTAQVAFLRALRAGTVSVDTPAGRFVLAEHPALWAGLVLIGEP